MYVCQNNVRVKRNRIYIDINCKITNNPSSFNFDRRKSPHVRANKLTNTNIDLFVSRKLILNFKIRQ